MSRGNTLSQAHPVEPRAEWLRRADPAPSRLARAAGPLKLVAELVIAAALVYVLTLLLLVSGPRP